METTDWTVLGALETVVSTCETVDCTTLPDPDPDPVEPLEPLEPLPPDPVDCDDPAPDVDGEECEGAGLDAGDEAVLVDDPPWVGELEFEPDPVAVVDEPACDGAAVAGGAPALVGAAVTRPLVPPACCAPRGDANAAGAPEAPAPAAAPEPTECDACAITG